MRRRILLLIGGTLVVMLVIISLSSGAVLRDSYAQLESRYIRTDVERVLGDLHASELALGRSAADYAHRAEIYQLARHPSASQADTDFTDETSANLRVDVILIQDPEGRLLWARHFGSGPGHEGLERDLSSWIASHPKKLLPNGQTAQGMIRLPQGLLLVAARQIQDARGSLPAAGTLVLGRLFDAAAVDRLAGRLLVSVAVYPLDDPALPPAFQRARARLSSASPQYLDTSKPSTAIMYMRIDGLGGTPVGIMALRVPRDIRQQGERTVRYFFIWLAFVGAGLLGVVILTIERSVLARLMFLSRSVLAIGTGGDPRKRVQITGRDQIAYLGAAINGLLDAQARATEDLRASERRIEAFLDAVPDAIFRVTRDGTIVDARSPRKLPLMEAAEDLVGQDQEMILPLYSFLSPELYHRSLAATEAALDSGKPQMMSFHVDAEDGRHFYEERFVASAADEVIVLVREVTDLKLAEEARRKEVLLKEIHHRVKNNLQVISSLLALQAGATGDAATRRLLQESRNRVHSMALIHEKLYQSADEKGISFSSYVKDLVSHLRHSYAGNSEAVSVRLEVEEITLDMDALVPCGLIINELVSNALKYAFPEGRGGSIRVRMERQAAAGFLLTVSDDGIGLPPGFNAAEPKTLGLRIVTSLVAQLHGTLSVDPAGPGASFTVTFPAA